VPACLNSCFSIKALEEKAITAVRSSRAGESSWPQDATLFSDTHVLQAHDGVAKLLTHSDSRSRDSHFEFQDFLQRTRWSENRTPPEAHAFFCGFIVSLFYFLFLERSRLQAILLISDVAVIYHRVPFASPIFCCNDSRFYVFIGLVFFFALLVFLTCLPFQISFLFFPLASAYLLLINHPRIKGLQSDC